MHKKKIWPGPQPTQTKAINCKAGHNTATSSGIDDFWKII